MCYWRGCKNFKISQVLPDISYGDMSEYMVVILIKMLVRQAKTRHTRFVNTEGKVGDL